MVWTLKITKPDIEIVSPFSNCWMFCRASSYHLQVQTIRTCYAFRHSLRGECKYVWFGLCSRIMAILLDLLPWGNDELLQIFINNVDDI